MDPFPFQKKKQRTLWAQQILTIDSDPQFETALKTLFQAQSLHLRSLRLLARSKSSPLFHWKMTPALPQKIFKSIPLLPLNQSSIEFHTSGTTTGAPGIHRLRDDILYKTATLHGFPWKNMAPFAIHSLHPDRNIAPHSSLSAMIDYWVKTYGTLSSQNYLQNGKIDAEKLWHSLQPQKTIHSPPLLIIGTAFSFVHLFDEWGKDRQLKLPSNSLVMETGGYKGRSRELPKKDLYQLIQYHFGIQDSQIWNEYGMTELSSQAYAQGLHGLHRPPPWARVIIIDPRTGNEVQIGKTGIVKWLDLANIDSSAGIQTLDFAIRQKNGFKLLGRAPQAERRGCSLLSSST